MKEVIRRGIFETNSSSVHSITMCSDDEYNKWKHEAEALALIGEEGAKNE